MWRAFREMLSFMHGNGHPSIVTHLMLGTGQNYPPHVSTARRPGSDLGKPGVISLEARALLGRRRCVPDLSLESRRGKEDNAWDDRDSIPHLVAYSQVARYFFVVSPTLGAPMNARRHGIREVYVRDIGNLRRPQSPLAQRTRIIPKS